MNKQDQPNTQSKIEDLINNAKYLDDGLVQRLSDYFKQQQQALLQRVVEEIGESEKGIPPLGTEQQISDVVAYNQAIDDILAKISQMGEEI